MVSSILITFSSLAGILVGLHILKEMYVVKKTKKKTTKSFKCKGPKSCLKKKCKRKQCSITERMAKVQVW